MSIVAGENIFVPFSMIEADTIAGTSVDLVAPVDGFIKCIVVTVQKAVTTGGTVKVINNTTDVTGAVATVANGAAKGTRATGTATAGHASRKVAKGDRIQVKTTSFATAGALNGHVEINTAI